MGGRGLRERGKDGEGEEGKPTQASNSKNRLCTQNIGVVRNTIYVGLQISQAYYCQNYDTVRD